MPVFRLRFFLIAGLFLGAIALGNSSCKKEQLLSTGGELRFSTDTLSFDTVFTTMGSATLGVKIYNPQSQKVVLSSVRMGRGTASQFRLNVDGRPVDGSNVEIAANDSIYVFATVKIDPTDENSPFLVEDRLVATLNGNEFSIPVRALGQNAYYFVNADNIPDTTLPNDKPWVIIGYAVVAPGATMTIKPNTRLYMHQNARLYVAGTLNAVSNRRQDSIIFQGDRLDRAYYGYEGYPGEWGGIYFDSYSTNNVMRHVVLRNCGRPTQGAAAAAIQLAPDSVIGGGPQLTMNECMIENSIGYGILAFGGELVARNCLVHSCGATTLALVQGGNYKLTNCTFATYGNTKISHTEEPVAVLLNFYKPANQPAIPNPLNAELTNCVIAGSLEHEFVAERLSDMPDVAAVVNLQNCVIKAIPDSIRSFVQRPGIKYIRPGGASDPMFVDINKWDYRLKAGSPLIDAGIGGAGIPATDLDDESRPKGAGIDIGAYESF